MDGTSMTPRLHAFAFSVAAALSLAAGMPASAQSFTPQQRGEIEAIVRDFLVKNPDILKEMASALEKQETAAQAAKGQKAVTEHAKVLFNSPRQVVLGNPKGD